MDDLLAKERATHEYVTSLQAQADIPFQVTLDAFTAFRTAVQDVILSNISEGELHERQLWDQHVATRQTLAKMLRELRKKQEHRPVETRVAVEMYLRFLRQSIRFYRRYIAQLSANFGGIPELEGVAQQVKQDQASELGGQQDTSAVREHVLRSCYRSLIYLGDLCRYRAADNLDKEQDFGPAVGYYGLAATLVPEAGWAHNQQALVALETKHYLLATYHLYKALLVAEPVALARKSLMLHFDRANAAWDRGELIKRGHPGDVNAGKNAVIGLFVRLHGVCQTGEHYRGYAELENELLNRITSELRTRSMDDTLLRMVMINIGAQHAAMDSYREVQNALNEQAFYYFMRINTVFFTVFLRILQDELLACTKDPAKINVELEHKLTPVMLRVLPTLRLSSAWLLLNSHLLLGLASNDFLATSIEAFWHTYARTIDLIAHCFPIWDLEDVDPADYMLPEDVEVVAYTPIDDLQAPKPVRKLFEMHNATRKPSFIDVASRTSDAYEALARVLFILEVGSYVANDIEGSPLFISGTRFVIGAPDARPFDIPLPPKPEMPKPLSYAAAAAKIAAQARLPASRGNSATAMPEDMAPTKSSSGDSKTSHDDAHMSRMVDSLVEDEETDHPITPPQAWASNPAVVLSHQDMPDLSSLTHSPKFGIDVMNVNVTASKQSKSERRSATKRGQDLTEFSPRPRPASGQLWSPATPQPASPSVLQRNANSPKRQSKPGQHVQHQRVSSNNSAQFSAYDALSSQSFATAQSQSTQIRLLSDLPKSPGELEPPVSAHVSPERARVSPDRSGSAHLASPLFFGGSSICQPDEDEALSVTTISAADSRSILLTLVT